ncbi:8340_t:CDS:2, partial [Diversispora eburnea]
LLIMILNNVQSTRSTQDIYSSLLVNRFWCKVTIPILWKLPLGQDYILKKELCIRTYISCMNTQARTLLIQNGFDLSSSPPQATFNYPSFTHKFIVNNLDYFIFKYSQQIIGVPKVFKKLETFVSAISDELLRPLYESLALICDNILNMELNFNSNSYYQLQYLARFIGDQKRLENLSIVSNFHLDCNSLLWVIGQKETLKSLRLNSVNFSHFKGRSSPIGQFISLQELYINNCYGLHKPNSFFFASSFTQLSNFHFHTHNEYEWPQKFIIKILETANTSLRNICLDLYPQIGFNTFSAILNYCTNITELTLKNLSPDQVIEIFINFGELRRFSFCCEKGLDANKLLCLMVSNVPKSLETIEIRIGIFSADSLRKFFQGW